MKAEIKALLLGVSLRYCEDSRGVKTRDTKRQERLTEAIERLTIHAENLEPDTLGSMVCNAEGILEWLAEHPKAHVALRYWTVGIRSPEFSDVGFDRYVWPFELNGAVEDFSTTQEGDEWRCGWSLG